MSGTRRRPRKQIDPHGYSGGAPALAAGSLVPTYADTTQVGLALRANLQAQASLVAGMWTRPVECPNRVAPALVRAPR